MTDQRAGWELIWRSEYIPPRYQSLAAPNPSVVEMADALPAGALILDVGCGVGRHCLYLGKRSFQVAGIDISPTGIETTRAVCAEQGIPFDGRVGDMSMLPWGDNTFDGSLSISTIHHHLRENLVKALGEVCRVLKPGGLFAVDFPSTDTEGYEEMRRQVAAGEISEPEPNTFVDERPDIDQTDDLFLPHHFSDEADLRDLLRNFEIVKMDNALQESGKKGKWVVMVRKSLSH